MFKLNSQQKEAIGLLSIGAFLEYFNLMLYIHMSVLLHEKFFSQNNTDIALSISGFALSSTFIFQPIGALLFGNIGDNIGRKTTILIASFLTTLSCITIAILPTNIHPSVSISWLVLVCRIIQGIAYAGGAMGARIYLTETISPPLQHPAVALITLFSYLGGLAASMVSYCVTRYELNWRYAFWFGAGIAVLGAIFRIRFKESTEFINSKLKLYATIKATNINPMILKNSIIWSKQLMNKTLISAFLLSCMRPLHFYFTFIYCTNFLKNSLNCTTTQVIYQNSIVATIGLLRCLLFTYLSYTIHPLKILKITLLIFSSFFIVCPLLLYNITTSLQLLLLQLFCTLFVPGTFPALAILYKHFPTLQRFTYASFIYALSRTLMYIIPSLLLIYLPDIYGYLITGLVLIGYILGLYHYEKLEKLAGNYY